MDEVWEKEIGSRARAAREKLGLSRPKVADLVSAHVNTIIAWEKGEPAPWEHLPMLAKIYDVDLRWLLHGSSYEDPLDRLATEMAQMRKSIDELLALRLEAELEAAADAQAEQPKTGTGADAGASGH